MAPMQTNYPETAALLERNEEDIIKALADLDVMIEQRTDLPREIRLQLSDIAYAVRTQKSVVKFLKDRIALRESTIARLETP
jgi:hypothetical protein